MSDHLNPASDRFHGVLVRVYDLRVAIVGRSYRLQWFDDGRWCSARPAPTAGILAHQLFVNDCPETFGDVLDVLPDDPAQIAGAAGSEKRADVRRLLALRIASPHSPEKTPDRPQG